MVLNKTMAGQVFTVLYTHQKTKKSKVWQDGIVKIPAEGNLAILYSDKGQRLESVFLKTNKVNPGDDLESDRFLITVEAMGESCNEAKGSIEAKDFPKLNSNGMKPIGLRPPSGLKRNFTGFQGPRELSKKAFQEVDELATKSLQLTHGPSSFASQLSATSPLFATPYRKLSDDTDPNEAKWSSNFSVPLKQSIERVHMNQTIEREHVVDPSTDGNKLKQNIRSTAQILALLKPRSSEIGSCSAIAEQSSTEKPVKSKNEEKGSRCTSNELERELSPVKPVNVKSRWEIYLDKPSASNNDSSDQFILCSSPTKSLDAIRETGSKHEKIGLNTEDESLPAGESKSDDVQHVLKTDNLSSKPFPNTDSSTSGPIYKRCPSPEIFAAKVDTGLALDNEKDDEPFSEITFNLTDSFDFAELDAESPTVDQPTPPNVSDMTKDCVDFIKETKNRVSSINTNKGITVIGLKDSNCTVGSASTLSDDLCCKLQYSCSAQTASNDQIMSKYGHTEDYMPFCNYKLTSKPEEILDSHHGQSEYVKSFSPPPVPITSIDHSVDEIYERNAESPKNSHLGISISLLRSLTRPSSALECVNVLKMNSPLKSKDNDAHIQSCADEAVNRLDDWEIHKSEDYQEAPPTIPAEHMFPSLHHTDDMPASCAPQPDSTQWASPTTAKEKRHIDDYSKTISEPSTAPQDSNVLGVNENYMPEFVGSDCDWEFSQWPSKELDTLKAQLELPALERPFFLRPRCDNILKNCESPLNDFNSIPEQHNFLSTNKISKVRSRLQLHVPLVSSPIIDVCSNFNSTETLKHNNLSFEPSSCATVPTNSGFNERREELFPHCPGQNHVALKPEESDVTSATLQKSKWLKYQSDSPPDSECIVRNEDNEFCAQSVFKHSDGIDGIRNIDKEPVMPSLDILTEMLGCRNGKNVVSQPLNKLLAPAGGSHLRRKSMHFRDFSEDEQILLSCELFFPCKEIVLSVSVPKREVIIPAVFKSPAHYKKVFSAALAEHLNIIMFEMSQRLHKAFSKVDMSFYTSASGEETPKNNETAPLCLHKLSAKLVMVRREGPNKGRFFYTCDAPKADQCKFFKWLDEVKGKRPESYQSGSKVVMRDMKSLSSYIRCQNINLYEESQLIIRKISALQKRQFGKFPKVSDSEFCGVSKTKLYLKLGRKEGSSAYSKDDLWVVSKTLNFDPLDTFIACSVFFGPSSNSDIEISPLNGYSPSNWPSNMIVHALLVCNASTELTSMRNLQEHFNPSTLPVIPHLLTMTSENEKPKNISKGKFKPPAITAKMSYKCEIPDHYAVQNLALEMIQQFGLNDDQRKALLQIAGMITGSDGLQTQNIFPITILHGVFGSGKSFLLAVVVLFLVQLFERYDNDKIFGSSHWKLLISSSTNVAVDRVLLGLLDLGFDQFIRVGSVRKIAKPILPHSLHAGSENENEQLKELLALLKEDLTPSEKACVRKSIEQHKLGTNKTLLGQVRVVGATCAACPFPCLSNMKFPVVILDECSQMMEPTSLLPIARFQCEKLIMVGDPKQLPPTIQGSENAHEYGLEQTLFNRLCLMGHQAVMLRTQYRCHPIISALANELFYEGQLLNGVSDEDRKPVLDWLPTLCFYNANGIEQVQGNNSFYNMEEASFTVKLIQSLIGSGIQGSMIGVITLYKSQMTKITGMLGCAVQCDPVEVKAVQVSTVDAFQGAEKEIIILSCVRTRQVGFIDSEKRMNVALTRGKRHLLIVGSLACLRKNKLWEQVIHHCERQNNGLQQVSQCDELMNTILKHYQEKKEESAMQKKQLKEKSGKT